ncbi:hypothetical protein L1987_45923 [Smallanthus sonchifolius]|uniref:Uncharacterized protein n=1 Tax=Smallanthus sonchifolius TaxID=185202 RepID=A0ACB9FZA5_9ASTR|nr:hypothetical protein L1987_45923 [Smallanthus sonchifolius]
MYSSLFEVYQWCKVVDLLGKRLEKRRKTTLISCFGEISGSRGMERNIFYLISKSSYSTSSNPGWGITCTLFSIVCGIRQYLGHLTKEHHVGFEAAACYWHFVDVLGAGVPLVVPLALPSNWLILLAGVVVPAQEASADFFLLVLKRLFLSGSRPISKCFLSF